jgi:FMN-dependent NADH-azoreductase
MKGNPMSHTILHIDSSPLGERSVSRKLTAKALAELKAKHPDSKIITRDLGANPLPHLSGAVIGAFFTPPDKRDTHLSEAIKLSDQAVDELAAADVIIIGTPMWNFGIPSSLKAWIDHIVRAGRTFKYGANGSESLLPPGKKVIIVSSRGGVYSDGPMKSMDYQETYLKAIFGFIGLHDVSFIRSEGAAMGEDAAKIAAQSAEKQLAETVKKVA